MTATGHPSAVPFTTEDYAARMSRVLTDAGSAGLDGVLVTPGPDLVWLTPLSSWTNRGNFTSCPSS